ncbi:MAG: N-acetyltransferase [Candidatus Cloacimonetes bacterium]|nr:N-acetyltransferase [Candidatus Cloacimonadota bacterium]
MSKYFCHESSYLDENVEIGNDTKIWHFCHVLKNTKIGTNCSFGQNCVIGPNVSIGCNVKVQNNVSLYDGVSCANDVFIGPSVVFTNVINPRSFVNRQQDFKQTRLKKGCSIGANATIVCGNTLGEYCMVGSGAVVTKNVKNFSLVVGVPAKHLGWVGISGERLDFDDNGIAVDGQETYMLKDDSVHLL